MQLYLFIYFLNRQGYFVEPRTFQRPHHYLLIFIFSYGMCCCRIILFCSLFITYQHCLWWYFSVLPLFNYNQIAKLANRQFFLPYLIWRKCILKKFSLFTFFFFLMALKANTNNNKHLGNRRKIIIFIVDTNSQTKLYGDRVIILKKFALFFLL